MIGETDCGRITLGDIRKANFRHGDWLLVVQNGKLKCNLKVFCNGSFSAKKHCDQWYLRCVLCKPVRTKCGRFDGGFKLPCKCKGFDYQKCGLKSFVGYTKNKQ